MTISTLVDAKIFFDMLGPATAPTRPWSMRALKTCVGQGAIGISPIVWAERADPKFWEADFLEAAAWLQPHRESVPFGAAHSAGTAHRVHRRQGGIRERTLPDFLVAAHALASGHRLPTRDGSRYRTYFPALDLISPETHP